MAEEKNGLKGSSNGEMSPQEDGTKVPLTDEGSGAKVEVKYTSESSPNGDAKIDMGPAATFSGLTKEELMKFSNDPFWVKLRWFLFILFWLAWLGMLVGAIIIIVLAPRCEPVPTLQWVQESPMVEYSTNAAYETKDFIQLMKSMSVSTAYMSDVINPDDFDDYAFGMEDKLTAISKEFKDAKMMIATDFMADKLPVDHVWTKNDTYQDFLMDDHRTLNYSSPGLINELEGILSRWVDRGFAGFLMEDSTSPDKLAAKVELNKFLHEGMNGAVASGIVDMTPDIPQFTNSNYFTEFLMRHIDTNASTWNYFKYNPFEAVGQEQFNQNHVPLVTIGLFLIPGTPIMKIRKTYLDSNITMAVIKELTKFRADAAIQFGNTTFVDINSTDSNVAYTRIEKGVPGYAVAVNLETTELTVDFSSVKNIPEKGKLKFKFSDGKQERANSEVMMNKIELKGLEAMVIQFVPKY